MLESGGMTQSRRSNLEEQQIRNKLAVHNRNMLIERVKVNLFRQHIDDIKKYTQATDRGKIFCRSYIDNEIDDQGYATKRSDSNLPFFKQIKAAARNEFFRGIEAQRNAQSGHNFNKSEQNLVKSE